MSYILDALRRADSERAAVPGLHTQAVGPLADDDDESDSPPARRSGARWVWPAIGGVLVVAGLAWWVLPSSTPPAAELEAGAPAGTAARAAPPYNPPPPVPGPGPATARPGLPPIAAGGDLPPVPESPAPRAPAPELAPARAAVVPSPSSSTRAGSAPLQLDALPAGGATAMPAPPPARARNPEPAASASAPRIYALSELPEEVRRELPSLQVAGSVYSPDPASRMLILNGQLFHEQDDLGNGVKVEQIKARAAVLSFKGYRYQISY